MRASEPKTKPKTNDERVKRNEEIARQYLAGESVSDIAAAFGLRASSVRRILSVTGITMPREALAKRNEEVARRHLAGESVSDIAAAFGLSRASVYRILNSAGVRLRAVREARYERIEELYRAGGSIKVIADELGVSPSVVSSAVNRRCPEVREERMEEKRDRTRSMIAKYRAGKPIADIAREFGVSHQSVDLTLKHHRAKKREYLSTELSNWQVVEMYQRWRDGEATSTLANDYGISEHAVFNLARRVEAEGRKLGFKVEPVRRPSALEEHVYRPATGGAMFARGVPL